MSHRQWMMVLLLTISVVVNYSDRSNLSISAPLIAHQFALDPLRLGALLSAFFWTYALMQIFGVAGYLADRLPVGWVMLGGYSLWSVATILAGFTSGLTTLFLVLLLLGVGESVAYPCYSRIFAELPPQHRGRANAIVDTGTKIGPALGAFLGGLILVHSGWRMLFFVLGAAGLLWILPWLRVMPRPRHVTAAHQSACDVPTVAGFAQLVRTRSAWGTFLGHFSGNYFFYFLLTWLPTYFVREEHLSIRAMSRLTAGVFLLSAVITLLGGWLSDRLIARGVSATRARRPFVAGGMLIASSLGAIAFVPHNFTLSLAIMAVASIGYGAFASNHWAICQTLSGPKMAGRWTSLQNGIANLAGIVAPWLAGWIAEKYGSLRLTFLVVGAVALGGSAAWRFLVREVEPVDWQLPATEEIAAARGSRS
ncbi:MAG: MFS transporter [Acidobacteriota bacterium]